MMRYAVPMATVKMCVQSKQIFLAAIDFVFREVEVKTDPLERLQDALTVLVCYIFYTCSYSFFSLNNSFNHSG